VTTLDEAYAQHGLPKPKAKRGHPEHALQTKLGGLAREYLVLEHEFAAHDRSENKSGMQHYWESERFIRKGWPDTEVPLMGGMTWRCELKAAGITLDADSDQGKMIARLNYLGHPTDWANSAQMWLAKAQKRGIEFRAGADRRAREIDALLAEAARTRALGKPKRASKPRPARPTRRGLAVAAGFLKP
jgi:hypothetical protein